MAGFSLDTNMAPATAPAPDNTHLLIAMNRDIATLMAQSEAMQSDIAELKVQFVRHSEDTEEELRRIRNAATRTREGLTFLRGKWQGVVLMLVVLKEAAAYLWPKGGH